MDTAVAAEPLDMHARLEAALQADDIRLAEQLADMRAADIADTFPSLREEDRSRVLFALPPHTAAEVVILLDEAVQNEVVDELDTHSLTELVAELEPDDAADVLSALPTQVAGEILDQLHDDKSEQIQELLAYGESTAGGIMTPDVVAVPMTATVAEAVDFVREASEHEDLHIVYLVDETDKLVGAVALRDLVTSPLDTPLEKIADLDPVSVQVHDDQETVVQVIRKYDAPEAAVVDRHQRLVGRVTHDDVMEVAEEEAAEDLLRMAGTDAAEFESHSILQAARVRLSWLLPCMLGMMITATVIRLSEGSFDVLVFVALAPFIPLVGAMGGNSGIQISTVIIRGFAAGDHRARRLLDVALREGRIALVMAPACGIVAFLLVSLLSTQQVAMAVGVAMTIAILTAGLLGIGLPFLFRRFGVDPAIASGPLVTTLNDVVSVSIYMLVAMIIAQ